VPFFAIGMEDVTASLVNTQNSSPTLAAANGAATYADAGSNSTC